MDTIKALNLVAATLAAAQYMAESIVVLKSPPESTSPVPNLTRAEALANLVIWRFSGMDHIARSEVIDWPGEKFQLALNRYQTLLASPEFQALVLQMGKPTFATAMLHAVSAPGATTDTRREGESCPLELRAMLAASSRWNGGSPAERRTSNLRSGSGE